MSIMEKEISPSCAKSQDNTEPHPFVSAILAAAGTASRMGGTDKLQLSIAGITVMERSVALLNCSDDISEIVIVARTDRIQDIKHIADSYNKVCAVVPGGETRSESVRNGLRACSDNAEYIAIHDAARPFASVSLISSVLTAAVKSGAAAPGIPVSNTLKRITDSCTVLDTVDWKNLIAVATPQIFEAQLYRRASEQTLEATDDCALVEALGHPVTIVPGQKTNIKITTIEDIKYAEFLAGQTGIRVGTGYDVHRLVEGRPLILGGCRIPFDRGLLGHSDADVLTHAIMDSLLGAAALGDIGQHFPDTDEQWKDVSSMVLLEKVRELLVADGYLIQNVDATLVCQAPRLSGWFQQMRDRLAQALRLPVDNISVKATTEEGLGFTGSGQGIAAQAIACIRKEG